MSPISALQNTRRARTRSVEDVTWVDKRFYAATHPYRDEEHFKWKFPNPAEYFIPGHHKVQLQGTEFFLPLGWHLSASTRSRIDNSQSSGWPAFSRCMIRAEIMVGADPDPSQHLARCASARDAAPDTSGGG